MTPLERLMLREVEFHRRLRQSSKAAVGSDVHTSWAIAEGYEGLISQAGGVTDQDILRLAERMVAAGDARDVLAARDSVMRLLGVKQFGQGK